MSAELAGTAGEHTWYRMSRRMEELVFAERGPCPNVDFYAASVYRYPGIPTDLFTPVFSVARTAGRAAHVQEQHADNRLIRPDSEYVGERGLSWVPDGGQMTRRGPRARRPGRPGRRPRRGSASGRNG